MRSAYSVTGPYDIIAAIEVADLDRLGSLMSDVHSITGIQRTVTCIAVTLVKKKEASDFRRLHNWLEHFEVGPFGPPMEMNGEWQIHDEERGLHASGHACGADLLDIAQEINPEILIPVHSEQPSFYAE